MAVTLCEFISDLITRGAVMVPGNLEQISGKDRSESIRLLRQLHSYDAAEMPLRAPDFHEEAAIWAAEHMLRMTQFLILRELDDSQLGETIKPFPSQPDAEIFYSADLCLRYLPQAMKIARALAPADPLVQKIRATAYQFPFSSLGMKYPDLQGETPEVLEDIEAILAHDSLRLAFIDRVIAARELKWLQHPQVSEGVKAALGIYAGEIWPEVNFNQESVKV